LINLSIITKIGWSKWSRQPRIWLLAAAVTAVAIAIAATLHFNKGIKAPGEELKPDRSYGWYASKDLGTVFTDGLNIATLSTQARGPLHLISARPLMDNGTTVSVIGVLARIVPDMLPPGYQSGGFQQSDGFPPIYPDAAGGVPVNGLTVYPPAPGQRRWIEIQIGYKVVAPGRSTKRGVELIYEYQGERYRKVIPSYVAICAPATASCEHVVLPP